MRRVFFAIVVLISGLGFLLSSCGYGPQTKTVAEKGAYAIEIPAVNPTIKYVSAPSGKIKLINSFVTVEAKIKTNGGSGAVFARGDSVIGTGSGIILYVAADGTAHFAAPDPSLGTPGIAASTTVVNDGTWHHLAGVLVNQIHDHNVAENPDTTCDALAMAGFHVDLYVDGHWKNCAASTYPALIDDCLNTTTGEIVDCNNDMGRDITAIVGIPSFVGTIDEVRLWKEARTQEQIETWMYTEITVGNWHQANPYGTLVGYWRFNQGTGSIATDSSGYGNSATKFQCVGGVCGGGSEVFGPWNGGWVAGYPF